ncbi:MAG: hypothetical protein A2033_10880 [Bacteroidetes bacterium GWA2_31_9]|nr:MAG: hypothetical protein A2033_10880 [Bacteroidetes bacterium GWA2_31_9]
MALPKKNMLDLKIPLISLGVFIGIGLIVWWFRHIMYFYLFTGIGFLDFGTRVLVHYYPKIRQFLRLCLQLLLGSFLLFWLGLVIGVNFQFPEIFFDAYEGVVTGALIQLVVARLILPFFLGNAFCSRACWTGFFFEMTNTKKQDKSKNVPRSKIIAWTYLISLVCISLFVAFLWNPAADIETRKWWIIGENLFIISVGFILTFFVGSRAYCRILCPFITISGLISPLSLFKITPINTDNCTNCKKCDDNCPMLIDVNTYVINKKRINDNTCILCERCISSCKHNVLKLSAKTKNN